jgi:hypothetical protein
VKNYINLFSAQCAGAEIIRNTLALPPQVNALLMPLGKKFPLLCADIKIFSIFKDSEAFVLKVYYVLYWLRNEGCTITKSVTIVRGQ